MTTYQKFKKLNIRHSAIGLEQSDTDVTYYCTPRDAAIIGWAGVDGIHYCTIPEFGEMIFAVSPMNFGDCVHPIAHSFEDLLRLLLSCGSMDALEQCYAWDEEQFKAFLIDCPATEEQQSVLDVLRTEFRLVPLEDAFAYVKKLQAEFDLSQIPYTEEYYDPDMNAAAPVRAEEWKVTYDGGFWRNEGNAGIEIPIQKSFCWGEEKWYIPAVYICDKGLVIDYCKQADPVQVKAFIDKWDLLNEGNNHYTKEQQEQIEREHPLHTSFKGRVTLNGYKLQSDHSCGLPWIPESCLADGLRRETEAIQIMEHYGLDVSLAWYMQRSSYRWGEVNGLDIQSLTVRMERQRENIAGQHFQTPTVGESISLTHPMTGKIYTLTVHEVEQQELPERAFHDPNMEYPSHYLAMSYSLEPDISGRGFMIQDCTEGDRPRQKKRDPDEFAPVAFCNAAVIGVIGGADASEIKRGHEGFKAGAKSINPDIEIQEVYTGDWTDTAGAKEAAIGMYDAGVDVIWHSGDGIGLGVVQAAAEKDMYCLGNVADQKTLAENNVLSGVVYQWDAIIANVFDDINNGTFKGRAEDDRYYWINAENNGLGIADINDPKGWLTDDDKQVIADTWSKLQSGEIKDYLPEDIQ